MSWSADPFIACSSNYGHGGVGSPVTSYRSQAARTAARSSRATLGELAGSAAFEERAMSTFSADQHARKGRSGSGADMPAVGADDSGEHERDYRRSGRGRKRRQGFVNSSGSLVAGEMALQLPQLGDVGGDAPRLVPGEPLIDRAAVRAAGGRGGLRVSAAGHTSGHGWPSYRPSTDGKRKPGARPGSEESVPRPQPAPACSARPTVSGRSIATSRVKATLAGSSNCVG